MKISKRLRTLFIFLIATAILFGTSSAFATAFNLYVFSSKIETEAQIQRVRSEASSVRTAPAFKNFAYRNYRQLFFTFGDDLGDVSEESAEEEMIAWSNAELDRVIRYAVILDQIYTAFESEYPVAKWAPNAAPQDVHQELFNIVKAAVLLKKPQHR